MTTPQGMRPPSDCRALLIVHLPRNAGVELLFSTLGRQHLVPLFASIAVDNIRLSVGIAILGFESICAAAQAAQLFIDTSLTMPSALREQAEVTVVSLVDLAACCSRAHDAVQGVLSACRCDNGSDSDVCPNDGWIDDDQEELPVVRTPPINAWEVEATPVHQLSRSVGNAVWCMLVNVATELGIDEGSAAVAQLSHQVLQYPLRRLLDLLARPPRLALMLRNLAAAMANSNEDTQAQRPVPQPAAGAAEPALPGVVLPALRHWWTLGPDMLPSPGMQPYILSKSGWMFTNTGSCMVMLPPMLHRSRSTSAFFPPFVPRGEGGLEAHARATLVDWVSACLGSDPDTHRQVAACIFRMYATSESRLRLVVWPPAFGAALIDAVAAVSGGGVVASAHLPVEGFSPHLQGRSAGRSPDE